MKHLLGIILILALGVGLAATVIYNYTLDTPTVKNDGSYSTVKLGGGQSYGQPGQPDLPWIGTKLLLPTGEQAQSIQIKFSSPQTMQVEKPVAPLQPQYPLSWEQTEPPVGPDPQIYSSAQPFPQTAHNGVNTQFLAGHPINFTAICPFSYSPLTGELVFFHNVRVEVETQPSPQAQAALSLLKQDAFTAQYLTRSVDNTDQIPRYETRTEGIEYLIIYDSAKLAQWQPLADLYTARGYNVFMKPVQEITAQFTGVDTQEKIRNYIISIYTGNSLRHVLLAADTDVIPHRGFYVNMGNGGETDADIPADMYYSCLDGNWNTDGDNYWGETYESDLAPELSIGRFCYNSDAEIANFINKTSMYLNQPVVSEITSALFAGEWLWDGPTWGGDYMDEMIGGSSAHGYTTVGVPTTWDIATLYDRTFGYSDAWDGTQLRPLLSEGPNFVNHLGHSNTTYCMRMSNNQVTSTTITNNGTNHNFSVYFTQGCYAGAFDNRETSVGQYTTDCITEKFTSISTAAVAMIAHSRYGWGMQGSTDGASQYIHRQYMDAVFGENINELGYTLADSKIDNIPFIQNSAVMYWVSYETNLIGDPGLLVWSATPQQMMVQMPAYWTVGLNNYQIQTNAPFANLRAKSGDEIIFEADADATGLINVTLLNTLIPGNLDLYIVAPNFYAYHSQVTVQASNMPYIVATHVDFLDADGLYHTGEQVEMNVTIKNVGLVNQTGPGSISLVSNSPNINVMSNDCSFNALAASDSTTINGFFRIRIAGNFADHSLAFMNFVTVFDGYTASTPAVLMLNSPELSLDTYAVVNDTPLVMPGDTPSVNLIVENTGSGNAYNPMLLLFCDAPGVTLSSYEVALTPIGHDSLINYDNAFSVQIPSNAQIGGTVIITYMLGAENGNTLEGSFVIYVGLQNYTYESDMSGWTTYAPNTNFVNQWHRENARNHTSNGSWSMKFGGQGTSDYSGSAYGALESPEITLGLNAQLIFYHWMDAETHSNPLYAWDGGMVEISVDNGPWTQITPVGGYPYRTYSNPASPFPANTNVYSGTFDWTQAVFDLSNYSGTAKFRFLFGSDGYVSGEGWYVDDLHVEGDYSDDGEMVSQTVRFDLHEAYPNPFNPSTTLSFDLPTAAPVRLDIYNVKGQLVRTLVNGDLPKGSHKVIWNGDDASGRTVASGVYLYRLQSGDKVLTSKMMLMK